jgi:hypothetical protein
MMLAGFARAKLPWNSALLITSHKLSYDNSLKDLPGQFLQ